MENKTKVNKMKVNKKINEEKSLKIGLGVGKGEVRVEGNFLLGWLRKTDKKYSAPKKEEEKEEEIVNNELPKIEEKAETNV